MCESPARGVQIYLPSCRYVALLPLSRAKHPDAHLQALLLAQFTVALYLVSIISIHLLYEPLIRGDSAPHPTFGVVLGGKLVPVETYLETYRPGETCFQLLLEFSMRNRAPQIGAQVTSPSSWIFTSSKHVRPNADVPVYQKKKKSLVRQLYVPPCQGFSQNGVVPFRWPVCGGISSWSTASMSDLSPRYRSPPQPSLPVVVALDRNQFPSSPCRRNQDI